jgi:hypothetical protein
MFRSSRRTSLIALALALAAGAGAAVGLGAAEGDKKPADGRFFEMRVYTAAPGKMDALNARFRDHTLKYFEKHGIESIGYWTAVDEKHQGRLYYILAYPDRESRERMLMNGVVKDAGFLKVVAESEKDGKLVTGIEEVFLLPTDYSPIK